MKIIINKTKFLLIKNLIKLNKKLYFKNIKLVFEKFKKSLLNLWILVCHAFTGSHHFFGIYKNNLKNIGWWNNILNKNFLMNFNFICINNINSHFGSTNHLSINPIKNKNYYNFPYLNLLNWIKLQKILLKNLQIKNIFISIGGSLGGMQTLIWNILYPNYINYTISIAFIHKMFIKNIIYNNISKLCINYNKNIFKNKFYNYNIKNFKNLKLARFIGHMSYMSKYDLSLKLNKFIYKKNFKITSKTQKITNYFFFKTNRFYKIFDINSYLFILKLINDFNIDKFQLKNIFKINIFFILFKNDERFNYNNSLKLINILLKYNYNINFKIINNKFGHDGFLIKNKIYTNLLYLFINNYFNKSER